VVGREAPDVVVLATGAWVPRFEECSTDGAEVLTLEEALLHDKVRPRSNVLVVSGERAGLVTAEYLSGKGCQVSVVEEGPRTGTDVGITFIWRHRSWIKDMGVREFTGHRVREVKDGQARLQGPEGKEVIVNADVIIRAGPRQSSQELERQLRDLCDELYLIGDAVIPRSLTEAIHEGYKLGTRL
jgi:2,4-dienoyl-CoA reductase (NADPH2)